MSRRNHCLPVAAILLAAGSGSRMGRLKQLLPFEGKTLVENAIGNALGAGFEPLIVVLGAESDAVRKVIAGQRVVIVENAQWQSGMGSSVAAGIHQLQELETDSAAAAILLADQPLVTALHLGAMRDLLARQGAKIVAAHYGGVLGVPAIFRREFFPLLAKLEPQSGARALLRDREKIVTPFDLPEALADVDTPGDFAELTRA